MACSGRLADRPDQLALGRHDPRSGHAARRVEHEHQPLGEHRQAVVLARTVAWPRCDRRPAHALGIFERILVLLPPAAPGGRSMPKICPVTWVRCSTASACASPSICGMISIRAPTASLVGICVRAWTTERRTPNCSSNTRVFDSRTSGSTPIGLRLAPNASARVENRDDAIL